MNNKTNTSGDRLWTYQFILLLIIGVLSGAATQMVTPLIMEYAVNLGAPMTIAATIASIISITALFLRPFSGMLSDKFNRRTMLIISTMLTGICLLGYSFSSTPGMMIGIRIVHGIAFAFMGVSNMAFATNYIPVSRMGEGIGWFGLSVIASQAFGPGLGVYLADNFSYSTSFICSAILCAASVALMFMIPAKKTTGSLSKNTGAKKSLADYIEISILLPAVTLGMFSVVNSLVGNYLKLIASERSIPNIGLFFTIYSITVFACRPFAGRLQDKKGLSVVLYPALIITAVSMIMIGKADSLWIMLAAAALKGIGQGTGSPAIQAECIKKLGHEKAGVATSTCYIGQDLGMIIGPIAGSFVYNSTGFIGVFSVGAIALLVIGGGAYLLHSLLSGRKTSI